MKYRSKIYRSALVLQMMLAHIHTTYSLRLIPTNFLQYSGSNTDNYIFKDPIQRDVSSNLQDEDQPNVFLRKAKPENQARMFNIDLSRLRHNTPMHKTPVNLLGIDIAVLSRNPDPTLPLVTKHPKDIVNGKFIMGYDFDPQHFDRLPVIKAKPIRTYSPIPKDTPKATALLPMMYVPLKVMSAYHSVLANDKDDIDFQLNGRSSKDEENEQKHIANFILHLLYELSSNYKKVAGN